MVPPRFELAIVPSDLGGYVSYEDYERLNLELQEALQLLQQFETTGILSEEHHYQEHLNSAIQEVVALESRNQRLIQALTEILEQPKKVVKIATEALQN